MARTHNNFKPKRSKKAGKKSIKLITNNHSIIKKLLALFVIILFIGCDTPYKVIETYSTDSTGKTVKTVQKLYSDNIQTPPASINVVSSPFWYNPWYYGPAYYPGRIVVPVRPLCRYNQPIPHRH